MIPGRWGNVMSGFIVSKHDIKHVSNVVRDRNQHTKDRTRNPPETRPCLLRQENANATAWEECNPLTKMH